MSLEDWLSIIVILLCLALSFFFSGSETALTAFSRARMLRMETTGNTRAALVNRLLETRERLIGAILTGNNVVNIAASSLATGLLLGWFGDVGVLYATMIMTVVVVVFTEVLPKTVAINAPDRIALLVAPAVSRLVRVMGPVLVGIEAVVRFILRVLGMRMGADQAFLSAHEELRGALDLLHHEGGVEKLDRDMLSGLLDLRDLTVSDVMIHRTNMVTVCADDPIDEVVKEVLAAEVTRIPLWKERPENIIGILHAKDLLRAIQAAGGDLHKLDLAALVRPPWFVPDIRPLSEQLKAFRRRKTPFALVVDEYGEVMGLVTLEDILEEIVGDINDEHDVVVPGVRPQPDGSVNVDGSVPIRDLNRAMDWSLPDDEATTIAGLVIHEARSIPEPGQTFTFHGFRFRVLRRERNRITALRITPLARKPAA
ncbi:MAG: HlyC/CorC family transporter [Hyphomicrobiales bacterium]|nr:HlyC/CorC family transporter [Hyphomicrobiales bacterium]